MIMSAVFACNQTTQLSMELQEGKIADSTPIFELEDASYDLFGSDDEEYCPWWSLDNCHKEGSDDSFISIAKQSANLLSAKSKERSATLLSIKSKEVDAASITTNTCKTKKKPISNKKQIVSMNTKQLKSPSTLTSKVKQNSNWNADFIFNPRRDQ